jgi:hypothetical protein
MRRTLWISLAFVLPVCAQTDQCLSAVERTSYVEELLQSGNASDQELEENLELIIQATDSCTERPKVAKAWYLRSWLEKRLKRPAKDARWSESQALKAGVSATQASVDPFLAVQLRAEREGPPPAKVGKKYALLVGVDTFKYSSLGINPLAMTRRDAEALQKYLVDPEGGKFTPGNVKVLLGADATLEKFRIELGGIRAVAKPEDLVLIYISSHGLPRENLPNGVSYVVMHDTNPSDAATTYATSLPMTHLVETLNRDLNARRIVLILDTCHSGEAAGKRIVPKENTSGIATVNSSFGGLRSSIGWAVLSASRGDQQSFESRKLGNGFFTYFLIEALKKDGGSKSLDAVFTELESKVKAEVWTELKREQQPVMAKSDQGGGIILAVPEGQ